MKDNMDQEIKMLMRGVVSVTTEGELRKRLASGKPIRVKLGVDPTAKDLHLGHTVCLKKMRTFQELGHTGVLIIGDFTARIGDPSGRSDARSALSEAEVKANAETYQAQAFQILDRAKTEVRYNSEWLDNFVSSGKLLQFLPLVTHSKLTEREDFKKRISQNRPITMMEIMYPIFQGYDSVAVEAGLELGGTDQTFNLLFGRDVQRDYGQEPQATMTLPILTGTDGVRKMSKTYGNAVALKDKPEDMFGKIMSIADSAMPLWIELLTGLLVDQLRSMHPMEAKMLLAQTITTQFHGPEKAAAARERFKNVHSGGEAPRDMPEMRLPKDKKLTLSQVIHQGKLSPSRKEAQRKIAEGGVKVDGVVIREDKTLIIESPAVVSLGRRGFLRVVP